MLDVFDYIVGYCYSLKHFLRFNLAQQPTVDFGSSVWCCVLCNS